MARRRCVSGAGACSAGCRGVRLRKTPAPPAVADRVEASRRRATRPRPRLARRTPKARTDPSRRAVALRQPGDGDASRRATPGCQLIAERAGRAGGRRDLTARGRWRSSRPGVVAIDAGGLRPAGRAGQGDDPGRPCEASERRSSVAVEGPADARLGLRRGHRADPDPRRAATRGLPRQGRRPERLPPLALRLRPGRRLPGDLTREARRPAGRRGSSPEREPAPGQGDRPRSPHAGGLRFAAGLARVPDPARPGSRPGRPSDRGKTHGALAGARGRARRASGSTSPGPLQLRVVARYADGHERDVTRLASFRVNDDSAVVDRRPRARPTCSAAPRPT